MPVSRLRLKLIKANIDRGYEYLSFGKWDRNSFQGPRYHTKVFVLYDSQSAPNNFDSLTSFSMFHTAEPKVMPERITAEQTCLAFENLAPQGEADISFRPIWLFNHFPLYSVRVGPISAWCQFEEPELLCSISVQSLCFPFRWWLRCWTFWKFWISG